MSTLTISPSPHVHSGDSVKKNMYGVVIAMIPALLFSVYNFGIGTLSVVITSVLACVFFEYVIQKYLLKGEVTITDGSAIITGILLGFNLPSVIPLWIIVIGALVSIGIGKMSFGGLGNNPFNPALVGRVFLLISFPVQMTSWVKPGVLPMSFADITSGATPLGLMKEAIKTGQTPAQILETLPSYSDMLWGFTSGSAGEMAGAAILLGLVFMLVRKIITWHIPVAVLGSVYIFSALLHLADAAIYAPPTFHLLSGGVLLGAVFMATDYSSSPMSNKGGIIFGIGIGVITVAIRVFGAYPEGISFAILIMNAFVPLIDKYVKPKRFGEKPAVAK
ncbi:RnfABCDGE type electron transport complex subunit D [Plebeiibacterium marinum]|uniref:Ion-translocating oxidoreductase complex subunit D n=1 Tax=Plebeiibacterium marinum TaxID=2992111 RepID=A0AAE3MDH0_9BACT|nr:RnfABCDGE type electron transport complex subunit D [Plebeiobacterium marinum]MCW3805590.1 RnfABCDGE type electron transport complex subunit D [Plebeiobacterium marinum]